MKHEPSQNSIDIKPYRVEPGTSVDLSKCKTNVKPQIDKDTGKAMLSAFTHQLDALQEKLYAQSRHKVLIVFQAMDAGGKDSTIREVFGPLNPQGVRVWSFKAPSEEELAHDYLWRIHKRVPSRGMITVFNRSHYEDVLIARVRQLVPEAVWHKRYDHIRDFERMLSDEGVHILKFFLHISKAYQKQRFERRLNKPDKNWKFNPADLTERARWPAYQKAYADAIARTSTEAAPWYIVPAERKWYRCLVVARAILERLEALDMQYPAIDYDPASIDIND